MNLNNYELYLKETKCEHGDKAVTVIQIDKENHKYSAIYDCGFQCAKFYLYPDPSPFHSDESLSISGKSAKFRTR
jgi:hypothetical protein